MWKACGYVRLSREDGDKEESNSITSQKLLIRDFLSSQPDLMECGMKVDDGFSGSSFVRPAFQEMMDEIRAGRIDCVVVKDLSRFGRNYLDAGEYIENLFPVLGVRFIAVNDHYDSLCRTMSDAWMLPFKNLVNEAYCKDSSIKIRSQLEVKRRRGDFTGAFAPYGYQKDPDQKNHLVPDSFAADVVRDIYHWKLAGVSAADIADRLNAEGVLAPMDYKRQQGIRYATPFRIYTSSQWNAAAVLRILKNPVYIGTLVQGRHTTPSYKVKKRVIKPKEQWAVFKGAHEAVIDPQAFAAVQRVLAMDIRTSGRGSPAELLSGMVYCKECGAPMVRKTVPSGGNTYVYYVCGAHKQKKCCSAHSIRAEALVDLVLDCLQKQIGSLGNARLSQLVREAARQKSTARKLRERIDDRLEEVCRLEKLLQSLYAGMADGLLSYAEYEEMKKEYTLLRTQAKLQAENMQIQLERELSDAADGSRWLHELKTKGSLPELDRAAVVFLVDRVFIGRGKQVRIVCLWNNA
ncbi:MAG: recombinase family protein [Eubacterium sp.]|jgi:Site-specific recombinases, DNA invertase Pin homologs|nr:recombinase family protein [Eubacterium sp.]